MQEDYGIAVALVGISHGVALNLDGLLSIRHA